MSDGKTTGRTQALVGAAVLVSNVALQISDYHSTPIAILLAIIAFLLLIPWLREKKAIALNAGKQLLAEYRKGNRVRSMFIVILIGTVIGAIMGAIAGAGWWIVTNPRTVQITNGSALVTEQGDPIATERSATPVTPPPRHINTSTVVEIHKELEQAGPLERDEVAEQFRHGIVDWTLIFHGDLVRHKGTDLMTVRFLPVNSPYPKITCPGIKLEGNAYLGRIRSPMRFRVRGVIGDIDLNWFTLHEATFEQLPDATPTPAPLREEGPKVVPPKQVDPKPKSAKSGVTNEEIFSLFNKGDTSLKVSRALEPYVGTVITIDGKLIQIHGGSGGGPIAVSMRVNNGPGASCVFDANWLDRLDGLKRDQEIRVRGKIRPEPAGNDLQLIECELLESDVPLRPSEAVTPPAKTSQAVEPEWSVYVNPGFAIEKLLLNGAKLLGRWNPTNSAVLANEIDGQSLAWLDKVDAFVRDNLTPGHAEQLYNYKETLSPPEIYHLALSLENRNLPEDRYPTPHEMSYKLRILEHFRSEMPET